MSDPATWRPIKEIDDSELWETQQVLKAALIKFARGRLVRQFLAESDQILAAVGVRYRDALGFLHAGQPFAIAIDIQSDNGARRPLGNLFGQFLLGMPLGTVTKMLSRAYGMLRESLSQKCEVRS